MNRPSGQALVTLCALCGSCAPSHAAAPAVGPALARVGFSRGICSVPDCGDGGLALQIARATELTVHALDPDQRDVDTARRRLAEAGLAPARVAVERLGIHPLPYADRFVDLVVLASWPARLRGEELRRVVRPRGCVLMHASDTAGSELGRIGFEAGEAAPGWLLARRPAREGTDDWPHWCHGPDNNPVSRDTIIRAPYLTQWLEGPYYHAMPVVTTAAAGRVFIASGHIAHHEREVPTLNTLVARNGYNGTVLWRRTLPKGYLVHRSAFVATDNVFYMVDGEAVLKLEPETGAERGRFRFPGVRGRLMWMAKVGEVMYGLAGQNDPPTEVMKVSANWRGWGWSNVDKNYSPKGKHQIRWGFGETLAACDLRSGSLLWTHEEPDIDSRGLAILGDRLFYYVPGQRLAAVDRRSGERLWTNEDGDRLALIEKQARGLTGTPGFRTTTMLLATPVGLFVQGQKRMNVVAFSLHDGSFLWSRKKFHNNPNMLYANGKLYISGIEDDGSVRVLNPATGDTLERLHFWKGSCTRLTASPEALYCRGEGLGRYDFQEKLYWAERSARPGCNDGAIPANGLLYVGPWLCDCNLSILGQMVLAPAAGFEAHSQQPDDTSLQVADAGDAVKELPLDALDWPAYRGGNQRAAASTAAVPDLTRMAWTTPPAEEGALQTQTTAAAGLLFAADDRGWARCFEAATGRAVWTFPTGGPVLASPTVWGGRAYVGSGDGYVYCLEAKSGRLLWRFRVAPVERRIRVYGRLCSPWPVNSGVLVHEGVAYAAAGIIAHDGTHVCAVDARNGTLRWHNGTTGDPINQRWELQAASALGTLTIAKGKLWLAAGNVLAPVAFDLGTGKARRVPGKRLPEWNAVVAQKPEPAGREVMVFRDRFLLHGGRLLYSGEGPVVTAAQVNFRELNQDGSFRGPAFTPVRFCALAPAWDEELFVTPTSRYGDLVALPPADVETRLAEALALMVELDKDIPGDRPQKWGKYAEINRVMGRVERGLRTAGAWTLRGDRVHALAVARNAVVVAGTRTGEANGVSFVAAHAKKDGALLWRTELPAEPRLGRLTIDRDGRVLVALRDGSLACVGP